MDIKPVEMERLNGVSPQSPQTRVEESKNPVSQAAGGAGGGPAQQDGDTFEANGVRHNLRALVDAGGAEDHAAEIVASGIEPDYLRAELARRAEMGDRAAVSILVNYLAGYFRQAEQKIAQLSGGDAQKQAEFLFLAAYLGGRPENAFQAAKAMGEDAFLSPLFCYAYADLLLSFGYVDNARAFFRRYTSLARRFLPDFVSEKEKYGAQQRRRGRQRREPDGGGEHGGGRQGGQPGFESGEGGERSLTERAALKIQELAHRRKVLLDALELRNVGFDKRPLLYELEEIDAQIARFTAAEQPEETLRILR